MPAAPIPFTGVDRHFRAHQAQFLALTQKTLTHGKVLQGPEVTELEGKLSALAGRKHAVAVGSCTDALAFALMAHGIGPGDEVLVTGLSFFASVSCILRVGAIPRFVDVQAGTAMMDLDRLDGLVGPRTRALLAVHLYGQCLPMDRVEAFAAKHRLLLLEDAAQAIGATWQGRPAGSMGRSSCFSFDPTKVVGCFGSAGAVLTDEQAVADKVRRLRYHGKDPASGRFEHLGFNSQLSSEYAGHLSYKLSLLPGWLVRREAIAQAYLEGLAGLPDLALPERAPGSTHNWHKFVIRTPERERLKQRLAGAGIATMVHYALPLDREPAVAALGLGTSALPVAEELCRTVLSLPIFPEMTDDEVARVVEAVRAAFVTA